MPVRTPHRLRVVRRVSLLSGVQVTVTDGIEAWFPGEIIPPDEDAGPLEEGPPREREAYLARWIAGAIGPGTLAPTHPSDRVESGSLTYELLGMPRQLRSGRRAVGVEVSLMPLRELYPVAADLQDQGGDPVLEQVPLAIWTEGVARETRGQYFTLQAEAPVEFKEDVYVRNRQFIIGGEEYRIIDPFLVFEVPRVRMTLRGPRI